MKPTKQSWVLAGGLLSAFAASLCCLGPLLAVILGAGSFAALSQFAPWRPYFLLGSFGLLALAWYLTYRRPRAACAEGERCAPGAGGKLPKIFLWIVTAIAIPAAILPSLVSSANADACCTPESTVPPVGSLAVERKTSLNPDRISLFNVPLVCRAAPEIGCGSRAKPLLIALERDASVAEAWLNTAGTVLAVVGRENSSRESRAKAVQSLQEAFAPNSTVATELEGEARERNLNDFVSGAGWYRGTAVDQLSRQEAGIIGARLVRRLRAKIALSDEKAAALQAQIATALERRFTGDQSVPRTPIENRDWSEELLDVARKQLGEKETAAFQEIVASGYRPQAGEK
ncbi:MAG: mercuric transporter MerT family protein [Opitutaceae bacterium]